MSFPRDSTKDGCKLAAALGIRDATNSLMKGANCIVLKGSGSAIDEAIKIISNPEEKFTKSYRSKVVTALKALKETISSSCNEISTKVKKLDPIPALDYVHSRNKTLQQRSPLGDITNKCSIEVTTPAPQAKKAKKIVALVVPLTSVLSPPKDGVHYSKGELISALSKSSQNSKLRTAWMNTIMSNKWAPVEKRQINKLMKKHEQEGVPIQKLDKPWNQAGRNPLLLQDGIEGIAMDLQHKTGFSLDDDEVGTAIQKAVNMDKEARGIQP